MSDLGGCQSCRYFKVGLETKKGSCRRSPPKVFPFPGEQPGQVIPFSFWPPVKAGDWCGEYRSNKEN